MTTVDIDSLQTTNLIEFDIEANRRRRAELANDVNELISISKFFLQHYSSADDLLSMPKNIKQLTITKREKNEANVNKARARSTDRIVQTKKSPVANATQAHVKRKHMRINNGRGTRARGNDDDVPPLFDKIKLHQYCVDVVDRFFHGPPPNASETSDSPKTIKKGQTTEKSIQTASNANGKEIVLSKPKKISKYATVTSRYMNSPPQKPLNNTNKNTSPCLVSAKSREILEEVARKGTEIKRHSCLIHKKETIIPYREMNQYFTKHDNNRSHLKFSDIHPNIELVPSNAIFPKRILKQLSTPRESSTVQEKIDEEEDQKEPIEKSNLSADSEIDVINPIEGKQCDEMKHSIEGVQTKSDEPIQSKGELKLHQLPVLSIRPQTKCEIESIYEIEIKPDDAKPSEILFKDKNKVIELVYESLGHETKAEVAKAAQNSSQNQNLPNKYFTPITTIADEGCAAERLYDENATTDETHETSHLSLNLSTSTHLTDDEKSQTDKKLTTKNSLSDYKSVPKSVARSVIDKILEIEGTAESNEENTSNPDEPKLSAIETQSKVQQRSDNFDDLREILRKIRSDKTTLDVALDSIEPLDFLSTPHTMTDREVQCNEIDLKTPTKHSPKGSESAIQSPHHIDPSLLESPNFNKTIESIRSSARKLDFSVIGTEYRVATRDQIEKAAKKFLKSILKNADENSALSTSERESSSYIGLKVEKQKYHIVDDHIIQSNFNVKSDQKYCTSSSSSSDVRSLQLRLPSAQLKIDHSKIKCNQLNEPSDSDFTENSIGKYINSYRLNEQLTQQNQLISNINHYSDLSDGEILSDGEFHIP